MLEKGGSKNSVTQTGLHSHEYTPGAVGGGIDKTRCVAADEEGEVCVSQVDRC